jgi:hypothetical protein
VEASEELGRRLVATRAVRRGEVVLVDQPAAMGPLHASAPLCLECSAPLPCPTFGCPYCGFPLCGEACVRGPVHELECGLLSAKKQKVKITKGDRPAVEYQAIMLLRLLCGPADQLARTDLLSDHVSKLSRQEREVYKAGVVRVVQGLLPAGDWTEEQLFRYISIIRTNACAVQAGPGKAAQRILHPSLATMNHRSAAGPGRQMTLPSAAWSTRGSSSGPTTRCVSGPSGTSGRGRRSPTDTPPPSR